MKPITRRTPTIAAIAALSALATPTVAVAASETQLVLEEVTVTARRRSENLQEVPVSVSAFSSDLLAEKGIANITELQQRLPNTTLQVSRATNSTLTAYIRGIGQQDPLWGFEPGVGIYVDDVYIARPQGAVLEVLDVERIEVLRGPQGTLYGKNTIGGALKYYTRRLDNEPSLELVAGYGTKNATELKAIGTIPLVEDKLFIGGGIARLKRDGFGEFRNTGADNYNKDVLSAHAKIEWRPSDTLELIASVDRTEDDSNPRGGYRLTPSLVTGQLPYDSIYDSDTSLPNRNEVETEGGSLQLNWQINDTFEFKSITSSRKGDTYTSIDFDSTEINSFDVPAINDDEQFTQEFQLNYAGDRLVVVSGLYYYEGEACGAFDVILGLSGITLENGGCVDTESYSAFAQGSYQLNDKLTLSLGGRYTEDKKDADVYQYVYLGEKFPEDDGGIIIAVQSDFSADESWNDFSPHLGLKYQFNDELMAYASFTSGFKSGGFDMRANASVNPTANEPFDPEEVDAYEVGLKSVLWDGRLRLNAAAFYNDYTDMQVTVQRAIGQDNFASQVINAGESEMKGLEVEAVAALTEKLTLTAVVGYIDAKFTQVDWFDPIIGEPVDVSDSWVISNTPEWSSNIELNYQFELGGWHTALIGNMAYRDETHIFEVPSELDEDAYTLFNASLVTTSPNQHWTLALHGKNLADEEYRIAGYNFAAAYDDDGNLIAPGLGGEETITGFNGNPRTVELLVTYRF